MGISGMFGGNAVVVKGGLGSPAAVGQWGSVKVHRCLQLRAPGRTLCRETVTSHTHIWPASLSIVQGDTSPSKGPLAPIVRVKGVPHQHRLFLSAIII